MGGVGARSATCGVYPTLPKYLSNKLNIWIELATTNETAGVQSRGGGSFYCAPSIRVQPGSVEPRDHARRLALWSERPDQGLVRS